MTPSKIVDKTPTRSQKVGKLPGVADLFRISLESCWISFAVGDTCKRGSQSPTNFVVLWLCLPQDPLGSKRSMHCK